MFIVNLNNDGIITPIQNEKRKLKSGSVVKGINTIDSFSFTILPDNPGFERLQDFKTIVTVYNTNKSRYEFCGRVLCSNPEMSSDGMISKSVTCESFFGFLCDSIQKYFDTQNWTVKGLLKQIIDTHNAQVEECKRFVIGEVSVTDENDNIYIGIQRKNTWETLKEKLLDQLGGEFRFRVVDGAIYIDYLTEIGEMKATEIALSKNMKSISKEVDPSAFITRLIPLGCKLTEEQTKTDDDGKTTTETVETENRLDIKAVNDGLDYIDVPGAVEKYGIIVGIQEWDDIAEPNNLLNKGRKWLEEQNKVQVKYQIEALDLSLLGLDVDDFNVGNIHPIKNKLIGIDDTARIISKTIDICEEIKSNIEIGDNFKTFSDIQREELNNFAKVENTVKEIIKDYVTNKVLLDEKLNLTSLIQQTAESIVTTIKEEYLVNYSDNSEIKKTVESAVKQSANDLTVNFTTTVTNTSNDLSSRLEKFEKLIRFAGETAITIGSDSSITLEIDNDKGILFKKNGVVFGKWDGENFYTGNIIVNVNERAQFGNFAFVPRSDGSLMLLKVR